RADELDRLQRALAPAHGLEDAHERYRAGESGAARDDGDEHRGEARRLAEQQPDPAEAGQEHGDRGEVEEAAEELAAVFDKRVSGAVMAATVAVEVKTAVMEVQRAREERHGTHTEADEEADQEESRHD